MTILLTIELLGTIAFAISGAMIAIDRELDLFGVLILGCVTACGGGIVRDVLLGQTPPQSFVNGIYLTVAAITGMLVFLSARYRRRTHPAPPPHIYDFMLNLCDAAGLGIFSAIGVQNTIAAGYGDNAFFCIFLGVCTGVGGGTLRDMMSGAIPAIFRRHVYALASIAGAVVYYYVRPFGYGLAMGVTILLVVALRLLASHYRWSLPKLTR